MSISADDFSKEINRILSEYGDAVLNASELAAIETGKDAKSELQETSPKRYGAYRKGWKATLERRRTGVKLIVHNTKKPQLTHLLENGHAKTGGGRVEGIPHIAPAQEHAEENYLKHLKEHLENDI